MQSIPTTGGSYIVWLKLGRKRRIRIGKLGEHLFAPGYYAYCGSAFGPGGLKARLGHHLKKPERLHWHIDYLKKIAPVQKIWYSTDPENCEHLFADHLIRQTEAEIPVARFGASDCNCPTHLLYFPQQPDIGLLNDLLSNVEITQITP